MNVNFGLFPALARSVPRRDRADRFACRALAAISAYAAQVAPGGA